MTNNWELSERTQEVIAENDRKANATRNIKELMSRYRLSGHAAWAAFNRVAYAKVEL